MISTPPRMVIQQNMQKDFFLLPRFRYHSTANHSDFFNTHRR